MACNYGWERQNMLVTRNVNIFNPFPNKPWFLRVCSTSLLKTLWEKEKLLVTSNFSFSHSVFNLFKELSFIFIKFEIVVCKLFQFGRVQNVVVWERVKQCFLPNQRIFCSSVSCLKLWSAESDVDLNYFCLGRVLWIFFDVNGGYLDFSHLPELKNICIIEIYLEKNTNHQ